MVGKAVPGVRLVAPVARSRSSRVEQRLSLRKGAVNAPMSKHETVAMITIAPLVAADPPENWCLPSSHTIVTGSAKSLYGPTLERPNPFTNTIKAMVSRTLIVTGGPSFT